MSYTYIRPEFFDPIDAKKVLDGVRKQQAILTYVKKDGSERVSEGVVCWNSNRNQFIINEELDSISEPEFRTIPLTRLKSVLINGVSLRPKRQRMEK